jgi:hypothetical protein
LIKTISAAIGYKILGLMNDSAVPIGGIFTLRRQAARHTMGKYRHPKGQEIQTLSAAGGLRLAG